MKNKRKNKKRKFWINGRPRFGLGLVERGSFKDILGGAVGLKG